MSSQDSNWRKRDYNDHHAKNNLSKSPPHRPSQDDNYRRRDGHHAKNDQLFQSSREISKRTRSRSPSTRSSHDSNRRRDSHHAKSSLRHKSNRSYGESSRRKSLTTHSLDVWELKTECEKKDFPVFKEPKQIGFFSLDENRTFHPNDSQLKYLHLPSELSCVDFDLNTAYEDGIKKEFMLCERIDNLLRWILSNRTIFLDKKVEPGCPNIMNADFVCYRGLLTVILCTIYEQKDDWIICATKYRGTIYLCAFHTEADNQRREQETERGKLMSSWGYKFEQYMTKACGDEKPSDPKVPTNEKEEFCCIVRSRLNSNSLIFGAEMDGLEPHLSRDHAQKTGSTSGYIELKTSRLIDNERQERNFHRFKLIKWWAQSFLIGIPKVYCGFRDDDGIVHSVKLFPTREIPKIAELGQWSATACMNFLDKFLDFVKECVLKDDHNIVYKFQWRPKDKIYCTELEEAGNFRILPSWFTSQFPTSGGQHD